MDEIRLLTRAEWGASPSSLSPYQMRLPAVGVYLHHSVTIFDDDGSYTSTDDVASDMREIERIGLQRFGRYSYSYNSHPSGIVGEGQGDLVGAHTQNFNSTTFGYCFIGNYMNDPVTDAQVEAFGIWWRWKVSQGALSPDAYVKFHRDVKDTACPGDNVVARYWDLLDARNEPTQEEKILAQEGPMLIVRRAAQSQRLLILGGFTYVAHVPLTSESISPSTPHMSVDDPMWNKLVDIAKFMGTFIDPRS